MLDVPLRRKMRWGELSVLLGVSVACGGAAALLPLGQVPLVWKLAVRAVFFAVCLLLVLVRFRLLTADERRMVLMPLQVFVTARRRSGPPGDVPPGTPGGNAP
jgi:hypothetical protein